MLYCNCTGGISSESRFIALYTSNQIENKEIRKEAGIRREYIFFIAAAFNCNPSTKEGNPVCFAVHDKTSIDCRSVKTGE